MDCSAWKLRILPSTCLKGQTNIFHKILHVELKIIMLDHYDKLKYVQYKLSRLPGARDSHDIELCSIHIQLLNCILETFCLFIIISGIHGDISATGQWKDRKTLL